MGASPSPAIPESILEFLVNWRWVLHHLLSSADSTTEGRYPQLFGDLRAMRLALAGSFSAITTVGAMPFGALEMARCGFYHLLLAERLLGCTPPTLHPFLTAAGTGGKNAASAPFFSREGGGFSAHAQAMAALLRWMSRAQPPILHVEGLFLALNISPPSRTPNAADVPAEVSEKTEKDGASKSFSRFAEAAEKLSQLTPFYLGAHTFITRSLLHYFTRTVLSIDGIRTHTRHLLSRAIPPASTVEEALMGWMRGVVKLLADAPGSSNEPPPPLSGSFKHSKDTNRDHTSFYDNFTTHSLGSSSFSSPVGFHSRAWVTWRQTFLHLPRNFVDFLHSGIVLSVVLYFYHPNLMPLEKIELVELSERQRGNNLSEKPRTRLPENSTEDAVKAKNESFSDLYKGVCCAGDSAGVGHTQGVLQNWGNILKVMEKLQMDPGLSADEIVYHGRGALQLHILRIMEALFAELATHAEEEVRARVEWELTQELISPKLEEDVPQINVDDAKKEENIPAPGKRDLILHPAQKEVLSEQSALERGSSFIPEIEPIRGVVEESTVKEAPIASTVRTPTPFSALSISSLFTETSFSLPCTPQPILNSAFSSRGEGASPLTPPSSVDFPENSDVGSTGDEEEGDFSPQIIMEPYRRAQGRGIASPLAVSMKMLTESQSMRSTQGAYFTPTRGGCSREELNLLQALPPPPPLLSKFVIPSPTFEGLPSDDEFYQNVKVSNFMDTLTDRSRVTAKISPKTSSHIRKDYFNSTISSTAKESSDQKSDPNLHEISRASEVTKSKEHSVVILSRKSKFASVDEIDSELRNAEESKLIDLLEGQMNNSVELPSRRTHNRSPPRSEILYTEDPTLESSFSSRIPFAMTDESVACFTVFSSVKQPLCRNVCQEGEAIPSQKNSSMKARHLDIGNSAEWDLQRVRGASISTGNSPKTSLSPLSIDKCLSDLNCLDQAPESSSSTSKNPITGVGNSITHRCVRRNDTSLLFPPSPESRKSKPTRNEKKMVQSTSEISSVAGRNNNNIDNRNNYHSGIRQQPETSSQPDSNCAIHPLIGVYPGFPDELQSSRAKTVINTEKKNQTFSYGAYSASELGASFERMRALKSPRKVYHNKNGAIDHQTLTRSLNKSLQGRSVSYDSVFAQLAESDVSSCNDIDLLRDTSTGSG
ncbi:unnamed protein product [Phytomonas sp. Hart1]|nr:unnamed protein product [Phytomonas sp. Hart1]|eukprot:CCW69901.1 unnamed protein product [Phytomonas sp. isolate Hart1]